MESREDILAAASRLGCNVLNDLRHSPPSFLPLARALVFYTSTRAGLGVDVEHGHGMILVRRPFSVSHSHGGGAFTWSAPWFISINGVGWGAVAGVERISALVGAMSERAVKEVTSSGGKVAMGTVCNINIPSLKTATAHFKKHSYPEVMLESDLVTAAVTTTGAMIDIGFSGIAFVGDKEKNARCYGAEATSSAVLGGTEVLPPEMDELAQAIQHASCAALVAAFEPSNAHSESEDEDAKA